MRVSTGQILWTFDCPFQTGDWTTVVYGAKNGRVFVGRGGNGLSASAPIYCLDAATGVVLWVSTDEIATSATLWNTVRSCSVSGDCGPSRSGDSVSIDEVAPSDLDGDGVGGPQDLAVLLSAWNGQ